MTEATRANGDLRPLTERALDALPGPRVLWILAWALIPWANAGANLLLDTGARSAVWEQRRALVLVNYAALSVGILIALWGVDRITRRLEALGASVGDVIPRSATGRFREMNSVVGPMVAAVATGVALGLSALIDGGWAAAILRGTTWFLVGIAFWTFLWTYASLQVGLDRLGREHLLRADAHADPTLGLRPLGDVAFTALWMFLAMLVPLLLTGLPDVIGVMLGMLVLAAGLLAFVFSLLRLHRQMAEVKAEQLMVARNLYAEAYAPVRESPTLETLERQQPLLSAADALEKRARHIHEWPIAEGTWARVVTIATSVVAITVARLILDPLGL